MTVGSIGLESPFLGGGSSATSAVTADNLGLLARMIDRGDFDLAGVGRALIANPAWADLVREARFDALRTYDARGHVKTLEQVDG